MKRRYYLNERNRRKFLEGLQRYRDRGVIIRIDGKAAEASEWLRILEEQPDGSFYMGDYIMEDGSSSEEAPIVMGEETAGMVCERAALYGTDTESAVDGRTEDVQGTVSPQKGTSTRVLKEIRFDRVYHR